MGMEQFGFVNVRERAGLLGCNVPSGMALLPRNFETVNSKKELLHESTAPTVRVLLRNSGIQETRLEPRGQRFPVVAEKGFREWVSPTLFVSCSLLSQNPHLVGIALGVISNYLTDFFKGVPGGGKVKLAIVVEQSDGSCTRLCYEGPVSGLEDLGEVAREVASDGR